MKTAFYCERIKKIRKQMASKKIDVFLVSPSSNLFYLTGYAIAPDERLLLLVLPKDSEPFIIANLLYKEQVAPLHINDKVYWKDGDDPFNLLKTEVQTRNIKMDSAALEPQMSALITLPLQETFKNVKFSLGSLIADPIRQNKDESELALIRAACKASDEALTELINKGAYWIGKTETAFRNELAAAFEKRGLTHFGASVQVGANAAIPHYSTGDGIIEKGKCLLVDFWGRLNGYYTDCTRTFFIGKPDSEFEKIYAIVNEAQFAAQEKAAVGNTLEDVDLAARSVIEKHGYGEFFTHRTGHGLGIDVHEGESVNTGVKTPIENGMVFSIEPGIYLPGRLGVRLENLAAVRKNAAEILHNFPRELKVI